MRICLLPSASADAAGARLRAFVLARALAGLGHDARLGEWADAEVVVVQKRLDRRIMRYAVAMRARGAAIIYDVDDSGPALAYWAPDRLLARMARCADLVTTDTAGHRERLAALLPGATFAIVPDPIDYDPTGPRRAEVVEAAPLRVLWFGSFSNFALVERYAGTLLAMRDVRLVVITSSAKRSEIAARFPGIAFLPWSLADFTAQLATCHLACLMHDGRSDDLAKSNNKMTASICWGVPAVVSATPEYQRTAVECGVETAVFADPAQLVAAIEALRGAAARRAYLERAQDEVWRRYAPQAVARTFLEAVARAQELAAARPRPRSWPSRLAALFGRPGP
jgi:hypothetical protein